MAARSPAKRRGVAHAKAYLFAACVCALLRPLVAECGFSGGDGYTYYDTLESCGVNVPCLPADAAYYSYDSAGGCCYQIQESYSLYSYNCGSFTAACANQDCDNPCYAYYNPDSCGSPPSGSSPSGSSPSGSSPSGSGGGLSTGAIVGIVIGVVVGVILLTVAVIVCCKNRKRRAQNVELGGYPQMHTTGNPAEMPTAWKPDGH